MEIVQQDMKSANSNHNQFEDIDSSDDDSKLNDSYQFDDDDMESSDDASTRSASKRYSKTLDGIAFPDDGVMKCMSKRKLAAMSTTTDDEENSTRNEGRTKKGYRKRNTPERDQSQDTKERYSNRGSNAPISIKTKYDASIERRKRKRMYSQGNTGGGDEPNREIELQRSHSADPDGRPRSSEDAGGIDELSEGEDATTEKKPKGEKEIRSAREQLRQLYKKDRETKDDECTSTEKAFQWEDEVLSARDQLDENQDLSGREPHDQVRSKKELKAEDEDLPGRELQDEDQSKKGRSDEERMRSSKKLRYDGDSRIMREDRDEEERRLSKEHRNDRDDRSARRHREEEDRSARRHGEEEDRSARRHGEEEYRSGRRHGEEEDRSARRHGEEEDRSARRHGEEEDRSARRHREEEYRRSENEGYRIRDERRMLDYGYSRDRHEERPRRSFVERYHEGERREGKPRHHSWHPDRGQSDIDVRPRRGERYPDVDRRSEGSWYQDRPRSEYLKIKPCDYFNSLGFCHHKSGHRSKSGTRVILHICRRCFYTRRTKEYHPEKHCHAKQAI